MKHNISFPKLLELSRELSREELMLNNHHSLYFEVSNEPKKYNNQYCYIKVKLPFSKEPLFYISNYFKIEVGNSVLVYTGNETNRFFTKVLDVKFYNEEEVPFPLNKTKIVKQVFDSKANIKKINKLKSIVDQYPPIKGIKYTKQF